MYDFELPYCGNPRDNLTTAERYRRYETLRYTIGVDLIDDHGFRSRYWFRSRLSAQSFADLWNQLHDHFGHTTRAEVTN